MQRRPASLALATVLACGGSAAAEPTPRHRIDNRELSTLRSMHPEAVRLVEAGENALAAGDVAAAAEQFAGAVKDAPDSAFVWRRRCQALALLGRSTEAQSACEQALAHSGSPLDQRAMALALTSGTADPTPQELADAAELGGVAIRRLPNEPWGYAALCDVFARVGARTALEQCVGRLERIAPAHYETRRARAQLGAEPTHLGIWLGWAALVGTALGTLGHALFHGRRPLGHRVRGPVAGALLAIATPHVASAAEPVPAPSALAVRAPDEGVWEVDDRDPGARVPTPAQRDADPLQFGYFLIELTNKAGAAESKKDYAAAVKYYLALAKAVPDEAVGFAKACQNYELLNEPVKALDTCRVAVTLKGVSFSDYERFARLYLGKPGAFTAEDTRALRAVVEHLKESEAGKKLGAQLECPLALRSRDKKGIEDCAKRFAADNPSSEQTLMFQWAAAVEREDLDTARGLLERAKKSSMSPAGIADMEQATRDSSSAIWRRRLLNWKVGGALLLLLLSGGGLWLGRARRRATQPRSVPIS